MNKKTLSEIAICDKYTTPALQQARYDLHEQIFRYKLQAINDSRIPRPPLGEQSRIVTRVAHLRRLYFEMRQRLTASQSTQAHLAEALVTTAVG